MGRVVVHPLTKVPQSNQRGIETVELGSLGGRRQDGPQSNQRGIETETPPRDQPKRPRRLNRTSVGLKQILSRTSPFVNSEPQSNQRGIETVRSDPVPSQDVLASIEPAWD